jgi:hypothetical protein
MALSQNQPVRVAIVRVAHSGEPKRSLIDGRARTPAGATSALAHNAAAVQHRLRTPILRPAGNVVANGHRALLAVGDGPDARRVDAVLCQIVSHCRGTTRSERDIVFTRTAFVGVAFDCDRVLRILLQPLRLLDKRLRRFRRQINGIGREIDDVADVLREVALRAGGRGAVLAAQRVRLQLLVGGTRA